MTFTFKLLATDFHDAPLFDPDAPGVDPDDPDTWPIIGKHSGWRIVIMDDTAKKRIALQGPLDGLDKMGERIGLEIAAYIKRAQPEAAPTP